jgi:hypothetical protein
MAGASNDDRCDAQDPTASPTTSSTLQLVSLRSPNQLAKMPIWIEEGYVEPHYQKSTDGNASVTMAAGAVFRHLAQVVGAPGGRTSSSSQ